MIHHNKPMKAQLLRDFTSTTSSTQLLVATSALTHGINYAAVRYVIHAEIPRSLLEFVQESGRAGRDGKPAKSIIFNTQTRYSTDLSLQHYLDAHQLHQCRLSALHIYLDGISKSCAELEVNLCDVCDASATPSPPQSSVHQSSITHVSNSLNGTNISSDLLEEAILSDTPSPRKRAQVVSNNVTSPITPAQLQRVPQASERYMWDVLLQNHPGYTSPLTTSNAIAYWQSQLNLMKGMCVVCVMKGKSKSDCAHEMYQCTGPITKAEKDRVKSIQLQRNFATCFKCRLPQKICNNACVHGDIVIPSICYAWTTQHGRKVIEQIATYPKDYLTRSVDQMIPWFFQRIKNWYGLEISYAWLYFVVLWNKYVKPRLEQL